MKADLLDLLRCPFCGGVLALDAVSSSDGDRIDSGVLRCNCSLFPIVAGIPYVRASAAGAEAAQQIYAQRPDRAFATLLGLDEARLARLRAIDESGRLTFRSALELCSPDAQGHYLSPQVFVDLPEAYL